MNLTSTRQKRHLIITGTGRAGTTFLVKMMTGLGLDTGYQSIHAPVHENCNAGLEHDLRQPNVPYVVKSPFICNYLDEVMKEGGIRIDHAIIPVRDVFSAAESRRYVERKTSSNAPQANVVPGGLFDTSNPQQQEQVLESKFYKLMHTVVKYQIPHTLIDFDTMMKDPGYLFQKIHHVMPFKPWHCLRSLKYKAFRKVYQEILKPELVHDFSRLKISQSKAA